MKFKRSIKSILPTSLVNEYEETQRRKLACNRFLNKPPGDYYSLDPFDYYKCIFVHIPKAAGVAVNKTLFGNLAGGHRTIQEYQRLFPDATFKKYFKFTVVRHPESRIVSAFTFLKNGGFDKRDQKWSNENLTEFNDINLFIENWLTPESMYKKNHFTPQVFYLKDSDGKVNIDFIGKLESLEKDFDFISKKLGVNKELVHINKNQDNLKPVLNEASKNKIKALYKEDYEAFGYC